MRKVGEKVGRMRKVGPETPVPVHHGTACKARNAKTRFGPGGG